MTITAETIDDLTKAALPSIIEGLKEDLKRKISWQVEDSVARTVSEHVTNWVKDNVLPEITQSLVESKEGLISAGPKLAQVISDALVEAITVSFKKKLENSYERNNIFKAIIGNGY